MTEKRKEENEREREIMMRGVFPAKEPREHYFKIFSRQEKNQKKRPELGGVRHFPPSFAQVKLTMFYTPHNIIALQSSWVTVL